MRCKLALVLFVLVPVCLLSANEPDKLSLDQLQLPILFEPAHGKSDSNVQYIARARGYTVLLEGASARFLFADSESEIQIELEGADRNASIEQDKTTGAEVNYFIGNDRAKWRTGVPTYSQITYKNVYPGIDWTFYEKDGLLEYDFVVAPGSDPSQIRMRMKGAKQIAIDKSGELIAGPLRMLVPFVYQDQNKIPSKYILAGDSTIQFALGNFDQKKPLVIDPRIAFGTLLGTPKFDHAADIALDNKGNFYVVGYADDNRIPGYGSAIIFKFSPAGTLLWSTFLGGSGGDEARGVAVTPGGIVYVVGTTDSRDFPIVGAFQPNFGGGTDAFIVKISSNGSTLLRSSYHGGSGKDTAVGIQLGTGAKLVNGIYIFGNTDSRNFPKVKAKQSQFRAPQDGFLTIVQAINFTRVLSTYIGFTGTDEINDLTLNPSRGDLYLTVLNQTNVNRSSVTHLKPSTANVTSAALAPITNYARKDQPIGSMLDGYVAGLNAMIQYKQFLKQPIPDVVGGVSKKSGAFGIVVVAGSCLKLPPATACSETASVSFLDQDLNFLRGFNFGAPGAGTFYFNDIAYRNGRLYIVGETTSRNLPLANAFQGLNKGGYEGFIMTFNAGGTLLFSSYLGGTSGDFLHGVAVSSNGTIHVAGSTSSKKFPTTPNAIKRVLGGTADAFVVKITP